MKYNGETTKKSKKNILLRERIVETIGKRKEDEKKKKEEKRLKLLFYIVNRKKKVLVKKIAGDTGIKSLIEFIEKKPQIKSRLVKNGFLKKINKKARKFIYSQRFKQKQFEEFAGKKKKLYMIFSEIGKFSKFRVATERIKKRKPRNHWLRRFYRTMNQVNRGKSFYNKKGYGKGYQKDSRKKKFTAFGSGGTKVSQKGQDQRKQRWYPKGKKRGHQKDNQKGNYTGFNKRYGQGSQIEKERGYKKVVQNIKKRDKQVVKINKKQFIKEIEKKKLEKKK